MNCVVRVRLPNRNLILKQARPWVEKYPSIAAPVERAASEARFYRFAMRDSLVGAMMPNLLDFDEKSALLVMEDLSAAEPLIDCYRGSRRFNQRQLNELAQYLSALHSLVVPANEREGFHNTAMRRLNHEHMFDIPLRQNGAVSNMLERITPGLDRVPDDLRQDRKYCDIVGKLGERYLRHEGSSLIHGDLFHGSLLQTGSGDRVPAARRREVDGRAIARRRHAHADRREARRELRRRGRACRQRESRGPRRAFGLYDSTSRLTDASRGQVSP